MIARALAVSLALVLAAGCGKKSSSPSEAAVKKLVDFRDRACTCIDAKCVELAKKELADWLFANSAELGKLKFTPAQDAAGKKASDEMAACVEKMNQSAAPQ